MTNAKTTARTMPHDCPLRDNPQQLCNVKLPWPSFAKWLLSTSPVWLTAIVAWGSFITIRTIRDEQRWASLKIPSVEEFSTLELRLTRIVDENIRELERRLDTMPNGDHKERLKQLETRQQTVLENQARSLVILEELRKRFDKMDGTGRPFAKD